MTLAFYSFLSSNGSMLHPYTDVVMMGEPRWNMIFTIFFIAPVIFLFMSYGIYVQAKTVRNSNTQTELV